MLSPDQRAAYLRERAREIELEAMPLVAAGERSQAGLLFLEAAKLRVKAKRALQEAPARRFVAYEASRLIERTQIGHVPAPTSRELAPM